MNNLVHQIFYRLKAFNHFQRYYGEPTSIFHSLSQWRRQRQNKPDVNRLGARFYVNLFFQMHVFKWSLFFQVQRNESLWPTVTRIFSVVNHFVEEQPAKTLTGIVCHYTGCRILYERTLTNETNDKAVSYVWVNERLNVPNISSTKHGVKEHEVEILATAFITWYAFIHVVKRREKTNSCASFLSQSHLTRGIQK